MTNNHLFIDSFLLTVQFFLGISTSTRSLQHHRRHLYGEHRGERVTVEIERKKTPVKQM